MESIIKRTTVFWTSLVSGILLFAQQVSALFGFTITNETVAGIMTALGTLLSLLVLLGILTNSEEADTFEAKLIKKK